MPSPLIASPSPSHLPSSDQAHVLAPRCLPPIAPPFLAHPPSSDQAHARLFLLLPPCFPFPLLTHHPESKLMPILPTASPLYCFPFPLLTHHPQIKLPIFFTASPLYCFPSPQSTHHPQIKLLTPTPSAAGGEVSIDIAEDEPMYSVKAKLEKATGRWAAQPRHACTCLSA
eukprot:358288-Chlamydomonas_euryale.AAC.10